MKTISKVMVMTATLVGGLSLQAQAGDLALETVRVRLPGGETITFDDGRYWQRDERVVKYKRYYYEPRERVYVVYNDDDHPHGRFCPPGQAKKGRC